MAEKQIKLEQCTVEVADIAIAGEVPVKELVATVGATTVKSRVTFGAENGPRPELTVEQLQALLDAARQTVAEEAAWRENLRLKIAMLT